MNEISITLTAPDFPGLVTQVFALANTFMALNSQTPAAQVPPTAQPITPGPVAPAMAVAPVAPVMPAPTAAPTYTVEQIALAATPLVDAGRQAELQALLTKYSVRSLMELPKELYGSFATDLRAMGVKI